MDETLIRSTGIAPELRGERRLCFYAAVFNVETTILHDPNTAPFREILRPGAFSIHLSMQPHIIADLEHRPADAFSDTSRGLILQEDARGLFCSCYLNDTPLENRVLADVRRGRYRGCSFMFKAVDERISTEAGKLPLHELFEVKILDVALTVKPAYPGTVVSLRSKVDKDRERYLRLLKLK